jgi:predicted phosphoadenosine phosphosulfate sulfurtransferase
VYDVEAKIGDQPIAIMVDFEKFEGKGFYQTNLVPIVPMKIYNDLNDRDFRICLPLEAADAISAHKS